MHARARMVAVVANDVEGELELLYSAEGGLTKRPLRASITSRSPEAASFGS